MTGSTPADADDPRSFELLLVAITLFHEGRYDYAVVAAQTAVETYLEQRLTHLVRWRELDDLGEVILDKLVRRYSFKDDRLRALWKSLTGDDVTSQDWWREYDQHVDRRHKVVHGGERVTKDEAGRSVTAASAAVEYVQTQVLQTGVRLGKLRELPGGSVVGRLPPP